MIRTKLHDGRCESAWAIEVESTDALPPSAASWVFEWPAAEPRVVWIHGMRGRLSRKTLRELVALLVERGVHEVRAYRKDGHVLPGATVDENGVSRIDVPRLVDRLARHGSSVWAELPADSDTGGV